MELLLFGGTTEGRELAAWLAERGQDVTLCVATDYGAELAGELPSVAVRTGRLDQEGMETLLAARPFSCVLDATHPYAVEVSWNLQKACQAAQTPYRRLIRPSGEAGDWIWVPDLPAAAQTARALPGNILLTTGSKQLEPFAAPDLRGRCFPRVLPTVDSLARCLELGFPPAQILCMQGPFSTRLNLALMEQYGIGVLITKASGAAGGFGEKAQAARQRGCALVVVERPTSEEGLTMEEMKAWLSASISSA